MLESVLLALYYLIESIQAQKYEKKPYFELLYPSPIDVNHGALPKASTASPLGALTSKPPSEDKQSKPETPTAFCTPTVSGKAS